MGVTGEARREYTKTYGYGQFRAPLYVWVTVGLLLVTTLFHVIAFSTNEWGVYAAIRIGLWKRCSGSSCSFHRATPGLYLKILPSSHSTAPWCILVNVSMWCLPTTAHKEWCARYYYRNDKESYTFHRQNPFILQHDVHTNIP